MKNKPSEFWLDVSTEEGLRSSLENLTIRWAISDHKGLSKESLDNFLARHLWPYLSEDFGQVENSHSFEMP